MHLNRNLMRRSLLKDCAYWKHTRLADKVWGWEAEGLLTFFFFFVTQRQETELKAYFISFWKPPFCGKSCVGVLSYDSSGIAGLGL